MKKQSLVDKIQNLSTPKIFKDNKSSIGSFLTANTLPYTKRGFSLKTIEISQNYVKKQS